MNLIYEATEYADGSSTEVKKYYYGTDLLGSVYGSAGTGGLRMAEIDGETVFAFNNQVGSIEALFGSDSATAAQARAEYIYSSYGEILMKSGDLADKNNITYSTRYQETNTSLVSYTYRHYSPRLKKWLSKDPIAESGGMNLYQMVGNEPVGYWDALGLVISCSIDIYFGHGSLDGSDPVYKSISQSVSNALNNNISPSAYAVGGTSCYDSITNLPAGNYGYFNSYRTIYPRYSGDSLYTPDKDLKYPLWRIALEIEVLTAKDHARKNMCKKPPKCCNSILLQVHILITDHHTATFWRLYGSDYKMEYLSCE